MPSQRHNRFPSLGSVVLAALMLATAAAAQPSPAAPPATAPADSGETGLAPPSDILAHLESGDPERHVEGFRAWHAWRGDLSSDERIRARDFIARDRYFQVLADEVLYDVEGSAARLTACKLLARIGGQRVFPIFLWSVADDDSEWSAEENVGLLSRMFYQPAYIKWYFGQHGDPTVIEHLPQFRWFQEVGRIEARWSGKSPPLKSWEPLKVEDLVAGLRDQSPARRRLAVRALANCGKSEAKFDHDRLAPLLADPDPSVRLTVAQVLGVVACPELRGPLKRLVEGDGEPIELRAASLIAVAHCGVARNWTAEWIVESLPDWPEGLDDAAIKALIELCPPRDQAWGPYRDFLRRRLEDARHPRVKKVLKAALKDIR